MAVLDDEIGREFIRLAFLVDKLYGGNFPEDTKIVDAYFVPKYIPPEYSNKDFRVDVDQLITDLKNLHSQTKEISDKRRVAYLCGQISSLVILADKEKFEKMSFSECAEKIYRVRIDEGALKKQLRKWHEELQELLTKLGYTEHRYGSWPAATDAYAVDNYVASSDIASMLSEIKQRMRLLFKKSAGEYSKLYKLIKMDIKPVSGVSWRAFNSYLGHEKKYFGRILINTDYKNTLADLYSLVTHEMFPGHQVHSSITQYQYSRGRLGLESTAGLIHTPQCVVREGIADLGESSENFKRAYGFYKKESRLPLMEKSSILNFKIGSILRELERGIYTYAALKYGKDKNKIKECMRNEGYLPENLAIRRTNFLTDPFWGNYLVCYKYGFEIMSEKVKKLKGGKIIIDEEIYNKIYSVEHPPELFY